MNYSYAKRMSTVKASEIREILKVTENPDIFSFAGGLPAPELFPVLEIMEATRRVLSEDGESVLQYTTTEGYRSLRRWIAERLNSSTGAAYDEDNILLTNGSQQALDLSGKVFLDEGDVVLCESPTYLAAISAFRAYGCRFMEVPTDNDGMLPEALNRSLRDTENVKFIYTVPNFQNPTGRTWSEERRRSLAELASSHGVPVLEDDPYGELRYDGSPIPPVKAYDSAGCVLNLGTFSKILCPGLRIGWIAGDKQVIRKYALVKQGTDLQSSTIAQRIIAKYLELFNIDEHIQKMREVYRIRKDIAIKAMEAHFPEEVRFTRPQGGLFFWAELPEAVNAREVLESALKKNIAFVPGGSFFPGGGHENTMRLNFSSMPPERIAEGLMILGRLLKDFC